MDIKMNVNPVFKGLYNDHRGRLCFILNIAGFSAMFYIYYCDSKIGYQLWSCQVEYDRNFDNEGRFLEESSFYKYIGSSESIMVLKILAVKWMSAIIHDDSKTLKSMEFSWGDKLLKTDEFWKMFSSITPRQLKRYKEIYEKRIGR